MRVITEGQCWYLDYAVFRCASKHEFGIIAHNETAFLRIVTREKDGDMVGLFWLKAFLRISYEMT